MALSYRVQLAEVFAERGQTRDALEQLYKALVWYEVSRDRSAMIEILDRILALDPTDDGASRRRAELTQHTPYR